MVLYQLEPGCAQWSNEPLSESLPAACFMADLIKSARTEPMIKTLSLFRIPSEFKFAGA
jgi:hypothetical protein